VSDTATVETLTAEVRVLMVGSRQVTLSVAKQLDVRLLSDVTVFGRVKLASDRDYVIGADAEGRLVLAAYERLGAIGTPYVVDTDLDGGKIIVCAAYVRRARHDLQITLKFQGRSVVFDLDGVQTCGIKEHENYFDMRATCEHWDTNGLEGSIQRVLDEHDAERDRHKAAGEAPLIVLAGLR
jgi:hypothetical protein